MQTARKDGSIDDEIPRLQTIPSADESIHESETRIGDLSVVVAEALRASEADAKATAKMGSFELAAVLQRQREVHQREEAVSGARLRSATDDLTPAPALAPTASEEPALVVTAAPPGMTRAGGFALLVAALLLLALGTVAVIATSHH